MQQATKLYFKKNVQAIFGLKTLLYYDNVCEYFIVLLGLVLSQFLSQSLFPIRYKACQVPELSKELEPGGSSNSELRDQWATLSISLPGDGQCEQLHFEGHKF